MWRRRSSKDAARNKNNKTPRESGVFFRQNGEVVVRLTVENYFLSNLLLFFVRLSGKHLPDGRTRLFDIRVALRLTIAYFITFVNEIAYY
jgi:hypothetical protein